MAKTIKEIAERILEENKDEIISVYDRYAGIVDGANAVLEEIEKCLDNPSMIQGYSDILAKVQELKGE